MEPAAKYLLVDASSAPEGIESLRSYADLLDGWTVLFRPSMSHWGDHRNSVLGLIPGEAWVLMIDDDELISRNCLEGIDRLVATMRGPVDALFLPRINTFGEPDDVPSVDWLSPSGKSHPTGKVGVSAILVKYPIRGTRPRNTRRVQMMNLRNSPSCITRQKRCSARPTSDGPI